jgi:hypothetical protein
MIEFGLMVLVVSKAGAFSKDGNELDEVIGIATPGTAEEVTLVSMRRGHEQHKEINLSIIGCLFHKGEKVKIGRKEVLCNETFEAKWKT